jgi:hypothetical protein
MPLPLERHPLRVEQRKQLDQDLACVEERLEAIAVLMCACHGDDSPLAIRAGEVAAALQRLKWELERTEQEKLAAAG